MIRLVEKRNMSTLQLLDIVPFQFKGTRNVNTSRKEFTNPRTARKGEEVIMNSMKNCEETYT